MENKPKPLWETYWKGWTAVSLQKLGSFNFQNLCRGTEITKVLILRQSPSEIIGATTNNEVVPDATSKKLPI